MDDEQRRELLAGLLRRYGVAPALEVTAATRAADAFRAWASSKWPGARWCREWPVLYRDAATGSIVRGSSDLVLEAPDGLVLIDHKSFPGSLEQALLRAASHAGQLASYATAISGSTGRRVLSMWVHMPCIGVVIRL